MQWHPFAERFQLLEGEEWTAFKESIRKTGGNELPVSYRIVDGKPEGLDGRNRFFACEELGITCRAEEVQVADEDVKDFILRRNVHRRHMPKELRQEIVAELRADGKSTRQIANVLGVGVATVHRDIAETSEKSAAGVPRGTPESVVGRDGKEYPATRRRQPDPELSPGAVMAQKAAERIARQQANDTPMREPGDDSHLEEEESNGRKPKGKRELLAEADKIVGRLVRIVDDVARGDQKAKPKADALHKQLQAVKTAFLQWGR